MPVVEHMIGGEKKHLMLISTLFVGTICCTRKQIQCIWLNLSDIHVLEASVQDELYKIVYTENCLLTNLYNILSVVMEQLHVSSGLNLFSLS